LPYMSSWVDKSLCCKKEEIYIYLTTSYYVSETFITTHQNNFTKILRQRWSVIRLTNFVSEFDQQQSF